MVTVENMVPSSYYFGERFQHANEHLNTTMSCLEKVEPVYFGNPQGGAWSIDSMNLKVHPFRSALDIGVVVQATVAMLR